MTCTRPSCPAAALRRQLTLHLRQVRQARQVAQAAQAVPADTSSGTKWSSSRLRPSSVGASPIRRAAPPPPPAHLSTSSRVDFATPAPSPPASPRSEHHSELPFRLSSRVLLLSLSADELRAELARRTAQDVVFPARSSWTDPSPLEATHRPTQGGASLRSPIEESRDGSFGAETVRRSAPGVEHVERVGPRRTSLDKMASRSRTAEPLAPWPSTKRIGGSKRRHKSKVDPQIETTVRPLLAAFSFDRNADADHSGIQFLPHLPRQTPPHLTTSQLSRAPPLPSCDPPIRAPLPSPRDSSKLTLSQSHPTSCSRHVSTTRSQTPNVQDLPQHGTFGQSLPPHSTNSSSTANVARDAAYRAKCNQDRQLRRGRRLVKAWIILATAAGKHKDASSRRTSFLSPAGPTLASSGKASPLPAPPVVPEDPRRPSSSTHSSVTSSRSPLQSTPLATLPLAASTPPTAAASSPHPSEAPLRTPTNKRKRSKSKRGITAALSTSSPSPGGPPVAPHLTLPLPPRAVSRPAARPELSAPPSPPAISAKQASSAGDRRSQRSAGLRARKNSRSDASLPRNEHDSRPSSPHRPLRHQASASAVTKDNPPQAIQLSTLSLAHLSSGWF